MSTDTIPSRAEYINNPFIVAVNGLNLLFLDAQGVAILLIILSLIGYVPSFNKSSSIDTFVTPTLDRLVAALPLLLGIGLVAAMTWLVVTTTLNGICGYAAAQVARGNKTTLKQAARATFDNFGSLLWLQFLVSIKLLGWSLLFIVPGVIMSVRYTFATTVFFDKQLRGNAAIERSIALTKKSWITTFASQIVFNAVTFGILSPLVQTATTTRLYRQYVATPTENRPAPHSLSIAAFVLAMFAGLIFLGVVVLIVITFATHGSLNLNQPTRWSA